MAENLFSKWSTRKKYGSKTNPWLQLLNFIVLPSTSLELEPETFYQPKTSSFSLWLQKSMEHSLAHLKSTMVCSHPTDPSVSLIHHGHPNGYRLYSSYLVTFPPCHLQVSDTSDIVTNLLCFKDIQFRDVYS